MFNSERTISATLKSICGQTQRRLDIVVVDDGSTDGSTAVVESWRGRDPRVRLVRQANAGVAAARNAGVAATSAPFLAFSDADDLWAPAKTKYQLKLLREAGPEAGAAYCWFATIDEGDHVVSFGPHPLIDGPVLRSLCQVNFIGQRSSLMVRRDAWLGAKQAGQPQPYRHDQGAKPQGDPDYLRDGAAKAEIRRRGRHQHDVRPRRERHHRGEQDQRAQQIVHAMTSLRFTGTLSIRQPGGNYLPSTRQEAKIVVGRRRARIAPTNTFGRERCDTRQPRSRQRWLAAWSAPRRRLRTRP
jgi:hypothetical protein